MNASNAKRISFFLMLALAANDSYGARVHSGITAIYGGPYANSTCARLADEHVQCWGDMFSGLQQLAYAPSFFFSDISMGSGFLCGIEFDHVACAGTNSLGQLGNGTTTTPAALDFQFVQQADGHTLSDVVQISAGASHVCALKSDRTVWCWGSNAFGQVGNFNVTTGIQSSAVQVVIDDAAHDVLGSVDWVSSGSNHTCIEFLPDSRGAVTGACWGYNAYGQLGSGAITRAEPSPVTIEVSGASGLEALQMSPHTLKAGFRHTCTMIGDTAACWGDNNRGATSTGIGGNSPIPAAVIISDGTPVSNITALTVGYDFSCLVFANTTGACWGADEHGQLGNFLKNFNDSDSPVGIIRLDAMPVSGLSKLVSNRAHSCALMQNAKVYCWGDNSVGQLGQSTILTSEVPVEAGDGPIFTDDFLGG